MRLVCSLLLLLGGLQLTCAQLRVGAFNIQIFGETKSKDYGVMQSIAEVVHRYDVIAIQEVRDSKPTTPVINNLMAYVNQISTDYACVFSDPLGDSNQKERYVFLYKRNTVTFRRSHQYQDPTHVQFSRAPFVVEFRSNKPGVVNFDFALVPLHSKPDEAEREIDALVDVVTSLPNTWTDNILLLGDFNAGSRYVSQAAWRRIRLRQPAFNYQWLIGDNIFTNIILTQAHDRIVATRAMYNNHVVRNSAQVDNFKLDQGLSQAEAEDVSDHYPVEVELR